MSNSHYDKRYPGYDKKVYTPYYYVEISGIDLNQNDITGIDINWTGTGANNFTVDIADPNMNLLTSALLMENTSILVRYGWKGNDLVTLRGYVSVIDIDFPSDGVVGFTLHCMDKTHIMNRVKKKKTWAKKKVSQVVEEIFKSYGFKVVIHDTGKVEDSIEQKDETDISFIESLLKKVDDNFITYLKDDTGYFVRRDYSRKAKCTLGYKTGNKLVQSFSPRIDKESQKKSTTKKDIDAKSLATNSNTTTSNSNKDKLK